MNIYMYILCVFLYATVGLHGAASSSSSISKERKGFGASALFSVVFKNTSADKIKLITQNLGPLASVRGQELSRDLLKENDDICVELQAPYFIVQSNQEIYYAMIQLCDTVVQAARNGAPIKVSLKPVAARMFMAIDDYTKPREPQTLVTRFIDLNNTPKFFELVEDALLANCGIIRAAKDSPSCYRRYLRASVE